jgi:hypothetical protein
MAYLEKRYGGRYLISSASAGRASGASTVDLSVGVAELTHIFLVTRKDMITAVCNGETNFLSSTSAVLTQTIS